MDIAELQNEINRLTRELDQAHTEKVQSATYGLSLLEEKQSLTKRYEELENLYENARQELEVTQEVILFIFLVSITLLVITNVTFVYFLSCLLPYLKAIFQSKDNHFF